jgi:hypothetical protein
LLEPSRRCQAIRKFGFEYGKGAYEERQSISVMLGSKSGSIRDDQTEITIVRG